MDGRGFAIGDLSLNLKFCPGIVPASGENIDPAQSKMRANPHF
jgi:hypothetical protein